MPIGCCKHSRELIMMAYSGPSFSWSRKLPTSTSRAADITLARCWLRGHVGCADRLGYDGEPICGPKARSRISARTLALGVKRDGNGSHSTRHSCVPDASRRALLLVDT